MINYEIWSCAVCPIKRWRVPSVQSCHDQSFNPRPRPMYFYTTPHIPAANVHLYTSPYKHLLLLAQTCALIEISTPLRRKTLLPTGSSIIIPTFPMIDFLTTISVQFRAFSIDWHVYKMRMNQKVNQMTNSLFTLIHHPTASCSDPIYFSEQKKWRGIDEAKRTAPMS